LELENTKSNDSQGKHSRIVDLIEEYSSKHFDDELKSFALNLNQEIWDDPQLDLSRGKCEIWAAAIVYVISRINYLFEKDDPLFNSIDELCLFFKVNKSTVGNKASHIQKTLNITHGDKFYTRPEISKIFEYYETEEGFVIPAFMVDRPKIEIVQASPSDTILIEEFVENQKRRKEEKAARRVEADSKRAETRKKNTLEKKNQQMGQYSLFGDSDNQ